MVLNEDHYGLEKPKERILEYLAVQTQVKKIRGPILCLVGPPGVGKTSVCRSIARAMGREFVRLSLGGVRDEAEIRGHRRTYIGAMPGKIILSMQKAGVINPVFCLDEVDKMSIDFRGDPSSALLEVLDPEQNYAFNDHYLDVDYDLSEVFFITTANQSARYSGTVAGPDGDHPAERLYRRGKAAISPAISCCPNSLEANGFKPEEIALNEKAILDIIRRYTREAGVRSLERTIASICRKVARERLKNKEPRKKYRISPQAVERYLGVAKYRFGLAEERDEIGLSTGMAWTEVGGELLQIEADHYARFRQTDYHRQTRRRHAGVGAGGPVLCALPGHASRAWIPTFIRKSTSMSMCPKGPSPRTDLRQASPSPPPSSPRMLKTAG